MKVGLFPGQGIHASTVLEALQPENTRVVEASEYLGYDLRQKVAVSARRKGAVLPTLVAQPAIFVASVAAWERRKDDERVDVLVGHSLGEFAALVAGGALSFASALSAVAARAQAMEQAGRETPGGMIAVLKLTEADVREIADKSGTVVANDNAPGQIVLSGSEESLVQAATMARASGGRCIRLEVSGPYHSPAMIPAGEVLEKALAELQVDTPKIPVISNVTAAAYLSEVEIRTRLVEAVSSPVRFRESLELLWEQGARDFIDFGPGEIVGGLAKRIFASAEEVARV